jgi:hypothetical protein
MAGGFEMSVVIAPPVAAVNPDPAIDLKFGIGLFTCTASHPACIARIDRFGRIQRLVVA